MDYYTPAGTSLTETSREVGEIDVMLAANSEVATFSRRLGTGLGGDLGEVTPVTISRLKPNHAQSTPAGMAAVLAEVQAKVPGVQVELAQLMEDLIGDLTAVPQPIEIKLYATDPSVLISQAEKVAAAIGKIDGLVEVKIAKLEVMFGASMTGGKPNTGVADVIIRGVLAQRSTRSFGMIHYDQKCIIFCAKSARNLSPPTISDRLLAAIVGWEFALQSSG